MGIGTVALRTAESVLVPPVNNMSLYQRWMQLPASQRIFAAAFTGILAYGGMKITDYFTEQGEIEREAQALVLREHQKINEEAKDFRRN